MTASPDVFRVGEGKVERLAGVSLGEVSNHLRVRNRAHEIDGVAEYDWINIGLLREFLTKS
jgi:hypothetical protein